MSKFDGVGLAAMFNEAKKANKEKKKGNPEHYYPKLIINRTKQASLYVILPIIGAIVTSIIFHDLKGNLEWTETAIPVVIFSALCIFLPLTEEWEYKPWQSAPQQMERELKE